MCCWMTLKTTQGPTSFATSTLRPKRAFSSDVCLYVPFSRSTTQCCAPRPWRYRQLSRLTTCSTFICVVFPRLAALQQQSHRSSGSLAALTPFFPFSPPFRSLFPVPEPAATVVDRTHRNQCSQASMETSVLRAKQTKAAVSAVRNRSTAPPPTIDFTIHVQDDGTSVSTRERVVKEVQAPAFFKPTDDQFYSDATQSKPDIAFLKNHFYREGRLTDDQVSTCPSFSCRCRLTLTIINRNTTPSR